MNKKGKTSAFVMIMSIIGVMALLLIAGGMFFGTSQTVVGGDKGGTETSSGFCPDDLDWSGTIDVLNVLNGTGSETFDVSAYFYEAGTNTLKTSITDTTSGSVTLTCGQEYDVKILSASDDPSLIRSASSGEVSDGTLTFLAEGSGSTLSIEVHEHGLPEVRAFDIVNDGFMFDDQDSSATDYETTDGVSFNSTTAGTDATAVGTAGEFSAKLFIRATVEDENYNDRGTYVLVDAASSVWDVPTVKIDGATATEVSDSLNDNERIAYSDYEYVYLISSDNPITKNDEVEVTLQIFALSGTNPGASDDISVDFAPIGQYRSTSNSNLLKTGSVTDSSSRTDVYTRFDTVFDIS